MKNEYFQKMHHVQMISDDPQIFELFKSDQRNAQMENSGALL